MQIRQKISEISKKIFWNQERKKNKNVSEPESKKFFGIKTAKKCFGSRMARFLLYFSMIPLFHQQEVKPHKRNKKYFLLYMARFLLYFLSSIVLSARSKPCK